MSLELFAWIEPCGHEHEASILSWLSCCSCAGEAENVIATGLN